MIGHRIREAREVRGMTLGELARITGISKSYLSQLENERASKPSAEFVARISSALKCPFERLLTSTGVPQEPDVSLASPSLRRLARDENLSDDERAMLSRINYRGQKPASVEGWRRILDAIRQSLDSN